MAFTRELADAALRYQVYLERLKAGEVRRWDPVLRRLERRLRTLLSNAGPGPLSSMNRTRWAALTTAIAGAVDDELNVYRQRLLRDLVTIGAQGAAAEAAGLDLTTKSSITIRPPSAAATREAVLTLPLQANGALLPDHLEDWQASVKKQVVGAVRVARSQGKTAQQALTALRGTKARRQADGVLTGQVQRATEAAINTAVQHADQAGKQATREAAPDDAVQGYRWVSVLDSRTTIQCASLDGQLFKVGAGPLPPLHYNCRSTTVADLRASGLVDPVTNVIRGTKYKAKHVTTYYEWLKTQPAGFQNDAIGPVRAKLFREGGLSAEEFARLNLGRDFEPLTLDEMRKLSPRAFQRAGL